MQSLNVVLSDRAGWGMQRVSGETNGKHPAQKPTSFFLLDSASWFGVCFSEVLNKIRVVFFPAWRRKPFLSAKLKTTRLTDVQLNPGNTRPHLQPKWKEISVVFPRPLLLTFVMKIRNVLFSLSLFSGHLLSRMEKINLYRIYSEEKKKPWKRMEILQRDVFHPFLF